MDVVDTPVGDGAGDPAAACIEIGDSRESRVGAVPVRRALPVHSPLDRIPSPAPPWVR